MDNEKYRSLWFQIAENVLEMNATYIGRVEFLRKLLANVSSEKLEIAVEKCPSMMGLSEEEMLRYAHKIIISHATELAVTGYPPGIPERWLYPDPLPESLVSFYRIVIMLIQKLLYLYGWGAECIMFAGESRVVEEYSMLKITLVIGMLFGINGARELFKSLVSRDSETGQWFFKGHSEAELLWDQVELIGDAISRKFSYDSFSEKVINAVPLLGMSISDGITLVAVRIMFSELLKVLPQLQREEIEMIPVEIEVTKDIDEINIEKVRVLINVMKMDRIIDEKETAFIDRVMNDVGIEGRVRDELRSGFMKEGFFPIRYELLKKDRYEGIALLTLMIALARADGEFHEKEEKYIIKVGKELGYDEEEIGALIREHSLD